MSIFVFFILLPFVQIGFSYFACVGTLLALPALSAVRLSLLSSIRSYDFIAVFLVAAILTASLFNEADPIDALVRAIRESAIFFLMVLYGKVNLKSQNKGHHDKYLRIMLYLSSIMVVLCLVQILFIRKGVYFGIPIEFFARNAGTLPDEMDLIYSDVRPSGTFGEPSYLSYVMFSIMVIVSPLVLQKKRLADGVFLVAFLAIFLSRSGLGFLFAGALTAYILTKKNIMFGVYAGLTVLLTLFVFSEYIPVFERFTSIATAGSSKGSGFMRLYVPLITLPEHIASNPFGISRTNMNLEAYVGDYPVQWKSITDNGLFNPMFSYGLVGIAMIIYLYTKNIYSIIMVLFLSYTLLQNGDPWSFDKLGIFLMVKYLFTYFSHAARQRAELSNVTSPHRSRLNISY